MVEDWASTSWDGSPRARRTLDERLAPEVEWVLRPCQRRATHHLSRLVCSRSATNEKLVQELWKGSELTRGRLWICRNGPKGRFPDFGFFRCVRTISLKRIVSSSPPPPPPPPFATLPFPQIGHGNGIEFIKFRSIGTLDLETEGVNRWVWKYAQIFRVNIEP